MAWKNGYIDERELVIFKRGSNATDGDWFHGLTPATYARHLELVRIAKERTGRLLEISEGWGAYRPYWAQVKAQQIYGIGAATPGTSSHGGYWERKETMAMDYSNWGWVYNWNRAAFYEDVRKAGLVPGQIEPSRGYPDEPWHVIDVNPRVQPTFASAIDLEENELNSEEKKQLARIDKFFETLGGVDFAEKLRDVRLFDGVEGVDLSIPRIRQALDASIDVRNRIVVDANGDGAKDYDIAQYLENEIMPLLRALIARGESAS